MVIRYEISTFTVSKLPGKHLFWHIHFNTYHLQYTLLISASTYMHTHNWTQEMGPCRNETSNWIMLPQPPSPVQASINVCVGRVVITLDGSWWQNNASVGRPAGRGQLWVATVAAVILPDKPGHSSVFWGTPFLHCKCLGATISCFMQANGCSTSFRV